MLSRDSDRGSFAYLVLSPKMIFESRLGKMDMRLGESGKMGQGVSEERMDYQNELFHAPCVKKVTSLTSRGQY